MRTWRLPASKTTGTDRVFVVHVTTAQPKTVIFWVEASTEQIDSFEAVANELVEALTLD